MVKPAKPAKVVKPAKPAKVVKPAESTKVVKPAEVTKSLKEPTAVETMEPVVVVSAENKSSKGGGKKVKLKLKLKGQPESGKSEERKPVGAPYVHVRTVVIKAKLTPFLENQKEKLLILRDDLLDTMAGVAKDILRSRAGGSEASAFGMHQADAGSDAYDRDFALSLLSQEQDALYEIEEALRRLDLGTYGICEVSGKPIPHARLEALPFARLTVECQSAVEKLGKVSRARVPVTSLFGLTDEEPGETEEEETVSEPKE
ncbi:MAG: TraR/DksA C4-type zinc finger protein [Verrucomicrobia bacterium]|nr:TraR/DksA C4-type zinc finger protein [Verrucomicrobiota bacterium]